MIKAYVIRHTDDNIEHRESVYMYDTLKEAYEHARKRADLFIERWHWNGVGNVYTAVGFTLIRYSSPSFFYIDRSGNYAGSRYQWQKHLMKDKLSNYIQDLPASENMKLHGYLKVWDCGQLVFEMKK